MLMSHGEKLTSSFVFARSLTDRGCRARTECDAHEETSNSLIVSDVLLGSTVEQVSALSPSLNLMPSVSMVLTSYSAPQAICKWSLTARPVRDIWWSWLRGLGSHRAGVGYWLGGSGSVVPVCEQERGLVGRGEQEPGSHLATM